MHQSKIRGGFVAEMS